MHRFVKVCASVNLADSIKKVDCIFSTGENVMASRTTIQKNTDPP